MGRPGIEDDNYTLILLENSHDSVIKCHQLQLSYLVQETCSSLPDARGSVLNLSVSV